MRLKRIVLTLLLAFGLAGPSWAEDSPRQVFQKYVDAVTQKNLSMILETISAAKRKDGPKTEAEKKSAVELLYDQRPQNPKVLEEKISKDGKTASMKVEAIVNPFFSFDTKKAKPALEKGLILFVKENGEWKIDEQKWGDLAEKEEKGERVSFGKKIPLKGGAILTFQKGNGGPFASVKTGKPLVVDLVFQRGQIPEDQASPMLNYAVHSSPTFADFYWKVGDQKITPVAMIDDPETKEVKVLEKNTTYSRSKNLTKKEVLSLLFDLPKEAQGPKTFWANLTVEDQKYSFQVGE